MPGNRFSAAEMTISAVVSLLEPAPTGVTIPQSLDTDRHSCLPDDCAGVFAPGWDISTDRTRASGTQVQHLAAYGLGSPFAGGCQVMRGTQYILAGRGAGCIQSDVAEHGKSSPAGNGGSAYR